MTKCDFCTESNERGKCYWGYQSSKREYCEKAIDRMSKALGQDSSSKNRCSRCPKCGTGMSSAKYYAYMKKETVACIRKT